MKEKFTPKEMVLCGLMAAVTAVFSQIGVPIGEIPVNLATLAVFLAGGLLGAYKGAFSMVVYIVLGAVGAPVFSAFRGGVSVIAGPTGGYIVGYVFTAFAVGFLSRRYSRFWGRMGAAAVGAGVCYLFGTAWFMFLTGRTVAEAAMLCILPYIPGDILKITAAAFLLPKLQKALQSGR